ncbi:hypothetical protein ACHAQH_008852 [Verticillium albo-atrum]
MAITRPRNASKRSGGHQVMALLLGQYGSTMEITERIVGLIAEKFDATILGLLLDKRGSDIQITKDIIKAAASNDSHGKEVLALILDRRGPNIQITEEIIKAAAGNWSRGRRDYL